jgi:predicted nucleotidyltransferase
MIAEKDRTVISRVAREYGVEKVLLFGSAADPERDAEDIDLGVIGIEPERFFEFYGDLMFGLSKPVDVVDLSFDTKFNALVKRDGIPLYT